MLCSHRPSFASSGLKAIALLVVFLPLTGCYRLAAPPPIEESVVIVVEDNRSRLANSQNYLINALAPRLQSELDWRISPVGTAPLKITINKENIDDSAVGNLGVPTRWDIIMTGSYTFTTKKWGTISGNFKGKGSASNLDGEAAALRQASNSASNQIIASLDSKINERQRFPAEQQSAASPETVERPGNFDNDDTKRREFDE